ISYFIHNKKYRKKTKMKKLMAIFVLALFVVSAIPAAFAAQGEPGGVLTASETGEEETAGAGSGTETQENTQNMGEETQIRAQVQTRAMTGEYAMEGGKQIGLQQAGNRMQMRAGNSNAFTEMEMTQEQTSEGTKLRVKLSNGMQSEVKVMPDTASERALERLRLKVCAAENGCQIELKEVGSGEQARAAYEVQAQKEARVLGLFKTKMQVKAQIDAENGEVIQAKKPWWAVLASESEE
ncbi:MAG: hypothetical protein PHO02_02470, partial [Candidatus Nanoarchaeia archaeon]|nr:hypothetical protein [Candidatus Nanoarchaeia archaeon]